MLLLQVPQQPSVVISAHPDQRDFVDLLRAKLTSFELDVWCTTDIQFGANDDYFMSQYSEPAAPVAECTSLPPNFSNPFGTQEICHLIPSTK